MSPGEPHISLSHGRGGKAMRRLIEEVFVRAFDYPALDLLEDQATIELAELARHGDRLAFTTDSYVVDPLFFPGGDIGSLAVAGTVNGRHRYHKRAAWRSCAAILIARKQLALDADIASDCQPLDGLAAAMLAACPTIRCLRDATRGGVATVLNEARRVPAWQSAFARPRCRCASRSREPARFSGSIRCTWRIKESWWPWCRQATRGACWRRCARTPPARTRRSSERSCARPVGIVVLHTGFGGERIVDTLVGERLPRIC